MRIALFLVLVVFPLMTAAADEPSAEQAISLSAESQERSGDIWRGSGSVRILYQDVKVECNEMEYNLLTGSLIARGQVIFDQGPRRFSAEEMHYNLKTKTGVFTNATADMPPTYHYTATRMERIDETHYLVENAIFTSCGGDDKPPWSFRIKRGIVEDEGYGRFRAASLMIKDFPVFHLPYLLWPMKKERAMGMMIPGIGYSQLRGAYLGNSFFIPIGDSWDTTVYLDLFSEGYVGVGSEWRWAPSEGVAGDISLYTIYDKNTGDWEWKINGKHSQDDFLGFRLLAEIHDLSDIDFFQEFDRNFDQNTLRSLYSYFYLTRSWGPAALNIRADRRTTFLDPDDVVLSQLPEIELRVRANSIGDSEVYWSMLSSLSYLNVDRGGELKGNYLRGDLFPVISYTLPGPPWLTITPEIGGRATVYSSRYSDDLTTFVDEWIDRTYLAAGVDIVGPSVSRIFNKEIGGFSKFKHLIEPRVEYTFLSDVDNTGIPLFDEVDSARPSNRARITLSNRLFGKTKEGVGTRELMSLDLMQDYSFSEPLSSGETGSTSQKGPLGFSLRVAPSPLMTFDARASYHSLYKNLTSTSLAANVNQNSFRSALTWYQGYVPATGARNSSQVRLLFKFQNKKFPWSGGVNLWYDVQNSELQNQEYEVHYEGSCWGITAAYRDLRNAVYPSKDYRILISLKDVGKLPEIHGSLGTGGF